MGTNSVLAELEMVERRQIMTALARKPALVLVSNRFDILNFYLEDLKFQELWSNYREIKSIGHIKVFEYVTQ